MPKCDRFADLAACLMSNPKLASATVVMLKQEDSQPPCLELSCEHVLGSLRLRPFVPCRMLHAFDRKPYRGCVLRSLLFAVFLCSLAIFSHGLRWRE
jgi:hypothetical protein